MMVREAIKYGLPEYYPKDFYVHDVAQLEEYPRQLPFWWCLRTCGTHLTTNSSVYSLIKGSGSDDRQVWYYWDGKTLEPRDVQSWEMR